MAASPAPLSSGRSPSAVVPGAPASLALLPGESVQRRFEMDLEGMKRLIRRRMLFLLVLMVVIFAPFIVLILVNAPSGRSPIAGVLPFVVIMGLVVGMVGFGMYRGGQTAPTVVLVTDRRVLVENLGKGESSAAMPLDNIGDVTIEAGRAAKSVGVAWVYLLPLGASSAMIGAGRARSIAPGVVWVPALRATEAEEFKRLVLSLARSRQGSAG